MRSAPTASEHRHLLALLGLAGPMVAVPLVLGGVRPAGIVIVGVCLAVAALTYVRLGWRHLMVVCTLASAPQALALLSGEHGTEPLWWAVIWGFTGLYAFAGFGPGITTSATRLAWPWIPASALFTVAGSLLTREQTGEAEGAGVAVACGGLAFIALVAMRPRLDQRQPAGAVHDVVTTFWATGVTLVALGLAIWLTGAVG